MGDFLRSLVTLYLKGRKGGGFERFGVFLVYLILMTHKYRGSIVVLSTSKSVEPNEEQKELISGFQQGILCKY